jgi:hypothetical protein
VAVIVMLGAIGTVITQPMPLRTGKLSLIEDSSIASQERFVVRVPEDYPTIQAAVDAVAEGGTVLIGPGLYKENLQIAKSVHLVGAGQEHVQLQYADPKLPVIDIVSEDFIQIHIQDLTIGDPVFPIEQVVIPPSPTSPRPTGTGLQLYAPVQMILKRVTIAGLEGGIKGFSLGRYLVTFPSQLILQEVRVARNAIGLMVSSVHLLISRSKIEENIIGSVISVHEERVLVSQSSFSRNRIVGISLALAASYASAPSAFITESEFRQNSIGIELSNAKEGNRIWIDRNRLIQNERYGIAIVDPTCSVDSLPPPYKMPPFEIFGLGNEFQNNGQDLCPADYPWPPGFRK